MLKRNTRRSTSSTIAKDVGGPLLLMAVYYEFVGHKTTSHIMMLDSRPLANVNVLKGYPTCKRNEREISDSCTSFKHE
jgi:hypothetical protein